MSIRKSLTRIFMSAALAVGLAFGSLAPAMAQDASTQTVSAQAEAQQQIEIEDGKPYPAATISAYLQAEGHQPVAFFTGLTGKARILTQNAQGEWLLLGGNAALGQSTHFGVAFRGTHLQTHDIRQGGRPDFANRDFDRSQYDADVRRIGQALGASFSAGFYDDVIEQGEKNLGLLILAQGVTTGGKLMTLFANPNTGENAIDTTFPTRGGVTISTGTGTGLQLSQQATAQFDAEREAETQYAQVRPELRQP